MVDILIYLIFAFPLLFTIIPLFTKKYAKLISTVLSGLFLLFILYIFIIKYDQTVIYTLFSLSNGISFDVILNYFTLPLLLLVALVIFIAISYQDKNIENSYFSYVFFLEFSLIGVFLSYNLVFFYVFWELVLIPSYFMLGRWGGPRKDYTSLKFLIYTHVGSVFMLISIFIIGFYSNSNFSYSVLSNVKNIPGPLIPIVLLGFFLAFFIKLPSFPFHSWAPDVYVESPTTSSMIFSGLLSKMGAFGIFVIFINKNGIGSLLPSWVGILLIILGITSIVYSALVALAQKDLKRMVAYASIGHMGFITLSAGVFLYIAPLSQYMNGIRLVLTGGMFMIFAHGIIIPILFGSVGSVERSTGTRSMNDLGGITKMMPNLAFIMVGGFLASLGLPGFAGFISEFSVVIGSWIVLQYWSFVLIFGMVVVASYHIWALQKTLFGPYNNYLGKISDMLLNELWPMLLLLIIAFILGIYPYPIYHLFYNYSNILIGDHLFYNYSNILIGGA
ncbi:MAG: complex I subunit 4 family protein [Thermoplasmata archaeon]